MTHHDLKCDPEPFAATMCGEKRADLRPDDRGFTVGDTLTLWEWLRYPGHRSYQYSERFVTATITHVLTGGRYGLRVGYVMLSLEVVTCGFSTATPANR